MAITRFCHYTLLCKDLDASTGFYRGVLGMDVRPRELPPGYPRGAIGYFPDGAWCVHFFQASPDQDRQFEAIPASKTGVLKHMALHAEDYVGTTHRLKAQGIRFHEFTVGDRHLVQFLDPDGLELELVFAPTELPNGPILQPPARVRHRS
jgi:catechol 2,3-dioxygenase-like lactoylglutathione lyase family enzyme